MAELVYMSDIHKAQKPLAELVAKLGPEDYDQPQQVEAVLLMKALENMILAATWAGHRGLIQRPEETNDGR